MVVYQAAVKGCRGGGVSVKHACAAKRARTVIAGAMTGRCVSIVLHCTWDGCILRRLPVREEDHVALAAVDILGGPSPLRRGEIIGIIGRYPGRIVSAEEGWRNLGEIPDRFVERFTQRGIGGRRRGLDAGDQ